MADADFAAVQKWKVPLLQKAAKRLCTDPHFQFMRVELHKFRRENAWVEASGPSTRLLIHSSHLRITGTAAPHLSCNC